MLQSVFDYSRFKYKNTYNETFSIHCVNPIHTDCLLRLVTDNTEEVRGLGIWTKQLTRYMDKNTKCLYT